MNFDQFINKYLGKSTDVDSNGVQCVDLIKVYLKDVFGIPYTSFGDAKDYYEQFNDERHTVLRNHFTRIANDPDFVPKRGILPFGVQM